MKKGTVPTSAEGMPKVNRSEIFRKARREYRFQNKWRDDRSFDQVLFAACLRDQWHSAKMDRQAEIERAAEAARLTCASAIDQRIAAIKSEMKDMEYGDFIRWARHAALSVEFYQLHA